jgi:threonine dehydratase
MSATSELGLAAVEAAAKRLAGVAHRTPVQVSSALDREVGSAVAIKCENLQRTGSFKLRGAYNAIAQLEPEQLDRGVVAPSSGNHAQAVALAARLLGSRAVIVMPRDAPASKLDATRGYGAEVVGYDRYAEDRVQIAEDLAAERGLTVIPPFDHPGVIAGQGTVALELMGQVDGLEALVVPVGGGGLIAGSAIVADALAPDARVIGVEPEAGDDTRQSLAAGRRVEIAVPRTIADGQAVPAPGRLTFEINRRLVDEVVVVSDAEIVAAMSFLFERMKLVAEPSGASAVAALLAKRVALPSRTAVVVSGGNVDARRFGALVGAGEP